MLWQTMRGLEETTMLLSDMAERFQAASQLETAELFFRKAESNRELARIVHNSLPNYEQLSKDLQFRVRDSPGPATGSAKLSEEP